MTEELKQAAQQALEALGYGVAWKEGGHQKARAAIDALGAALTAAQPAQEVGANCKTCNGHGLVGGHMQDGSGYGEGCPDCNPEPAPLVKWASTQPAAQATPDHFPDAGKMVQATPEPVGEVRCEGCGYMTHHREHMGCVRAAKQHTRPAQDVPEGLPAVLTDWGFDVHDDEEGRTWLTIRNPDDDVARMSVPTVCPLNGNQTIGAVVLHQFSAALTSALAAAQAKGQ